jgi:hypothetical protein
VYNVGDVETTTRAQTMSAVEVFSGPMKSNDPRRFFIEAMIGAMRSDGDTSPAEVALLEKHISNHAWLRGLPTNAIGMMVEMASEAIHFAGGSLNRVPAIARGLCFRTHRLLAFALACEICSVDSVVVDAERTFIESLRVALRVSTLETDEILQAIDRDQLQPFLANRMERIWALRPVVSELFTIRAISKNRLVDEHRFAVRAFFCSITDLQGPTDEIDTELFHCFRRLRAPSIDGSLDGPRDVGQSVTTQLTNLAKQLPNPLDRYWLVVYALAAEAPAQVASWKLIPFIGLLQNVFQLVDRDLALAAQDAMGFPANLPRPA